MAWKKPFFKRVSSKISARMLNLMTLLPLGESREALCVRQVEGHSFAAGAFIAVCSCVCYG